MVNKNEVVYFNVSIFVLFVENNRGMKKLEFYIPFPTDNRGHIVKICKIYTQQILF